MSLHKTLTKLGYALDKKKIDDIKKLKKDLTVKPFNKYVETVEYELFRETKEYIYVPKYYGIEHYGKFNRMLQMNGAEVNFSFMKTLREYQHEIVDKTMEQLKTTGGGILSLYCGGGKTVLALYLAAKLKVKVLIVVNKTFLLNQWVNRIKEFTDAKIGTIRQKVIDVEGRDIVIGMLQSISLIDYDSGIFKDFGLVIYDEVHRYASKCFSKALYKTTCRYTLGLSATPDRPDGMTKVLTWYIGDIYLRMKRDTEHNHKVKTLLFKYKSSNSLFVEKKAWVAKLKKRCPNTSIMASNICNIKSKNKLILDVLDKVRQLDDRRIILLSSRVEHLKILKSQYDKMLKELIDKELLDADEITTSLYYGDMKKYELRFAEENADILFATFHMAQEGLDLPGLNTVILASPPQKTDIEQSVGRGLREELKTCEINPILIDFADMLSTFNAMSNAREQFYIAENYDVTTYYIYDDELVSEVEYARRTYDLDDAELAFHIKTEYDTKKERDVACKKPPSLTKIIKQDLLCN